MTSPAHTLLRRRLPATAVAVVAAWAAGLVLLAAPASAAASVLFVDQGNPACSDTGSGTQTKPYCTIVKAAVVAIGGDFAERLHGAGGEPAW